MAEQLDTSNELARAEAAARVKMSVVGIGGCGNNTITNLSRSAIRAGLNSAELVATNTDAAVLKSTKANKHVLAGESNTRGRSAAGEVELGKKAMGEAIDRMLGLLSDKEVIILTSGLGGGAGTGGHIVLAEQIKKKLEASLLLSVVTLPFASEGRKRVENARMGLREIMRLSDTTFVNFNDKLKEKNPNAPVVRAYKIMDNRLTNTVTGLMGLQEVRPIPGSMNVDFNNFIKIAQKSGLGFAGTGEGYALREAFERSVEDPYGNADISACRGAVVYLEGPQTSLRIDDATSIPAQLTDKYQIPDVYFGLKPSWELGTTRLTLFATGTRSTLVDKYLAAN